MFFHNGNIQPKKTEECLNIVGSMSSFTWKYLLDVSGSSWSRDVLKLAELQFFYSVGLVSLDIAFGILFFIMFRGS